MFEGTYSPPVYNDLYNFRDGAQDDIFVDSYLSIPDPAPNAAMPILADVSAKSPIPYIITTGNTTTTQANDTSTQVAAETYFGKRDMSNIAANVQMMRRSRRAYRRRRSIMW